MNKEVYYTGETIRLQAVFYGFDGYKVDPDLIAVKIYDSSYNLITTISIDSVVNRISEGTYFCNYKSNDSGTFIYEWYAEIGGSTCVKRDKFVFTFF